MRQEAEAQRTEDAQLRSSQSYSQSSLLKKGNKGEQDLAIESEPERYMETADELDDGFSNRPYTPADIAEREAIQDANKMFDRWLRNIMTARAKTPQAPKRYVM